MRCHAMVCSNGKRVQHQAIKLITVLACLTSCQAGQDLGNTPGLLPDPSTAVVEAPQVTPQQTATAQKTLAALPIKGRAPMTGYSRNQFGSPWKDTDRNGCDTRNDILKRDLTQTTSTKCRVQTGTLNDPYTGHTIQWRRGQNTSSAVQIDHIVALGNAWATGAQQLTTEQRTQLANDPQNLQAVDGPTNQTKSDADAATWLPPNKTYRCTYVIKQVHIKNVYKLWVTKAEKESINRILNKC